MGWTSLSKSNNSYFLLISIFYVLDLGDRFNSSFFWHILGTFWFFRKIIRLTVNSGLHGRNFIFIISQEKVQFDVNFGLRRRSYLIRRHSFLIFLEMHQLIVHRFHFYSFFFKFYVFCLLSHWVEKLYSLVSH